MSVVPCLNEGCKLHAVVERKHFANRNLSAFEHLSRISISHDRSVGHNLHKSVRTDVSRGDCWDGTMFWVVRVEVHVSTH